MAGIFPGFFWVEFSAGEWVYAEIRRGVEIAEGFVRVGIPGFFLGGASC